MVFKIFNGQRNQKRYRVRKLLMAEFQEESGKPNIRRERLVGLLEKRHGYTNEQADVEFERLLKRIYGMDRSSGIPKTKVKSRNPRPEQTHKD